jgi:hypothetical protein
MAGDRATSSISATSMSLFQSWSSPLVALPLLHQPVSVNRLDPARAELEDLETALEDLIHVPHLSSSSRRFGLYHLLQYIPISCSSQRSRVLGSLLRCLSWEMAYFRLRSLQYIPHCRQKLHRLDPLQLVGRPTRRISLVFFIRCTSLILLICRIALLLHVHIFSLVL